VPGLLPEQVREFLADARGYLMASNLKNGARNILIRFLFMIYIVAV
jgi:hypothetical protein